MKLPDISTVFTHVSCISVGLTLAWAYVYLHRDTPDTRRIAGDAFNEAHPEIQPASLSAFGEIYKNDSFLCSATLLKPGTLISSIAHCFDDAVAEDAFEFRTMLPDGETIAVPLDITTRYFRVDKALLNDDAAAFISLSDAPEGIIPAGIGNSMGIEPGAVYVAGHSPHVRIQHEGITSLSISEKPCYAYLSTPWEIRSTCYISNGDSGGHHFTWDEKNGVEVVSANSGYSWFGPLVTAARAEIDHAGIATKFRRVSRSAYLASLRDFCIEEIGSEYCSAFPLPVTASP